MILVSQRETKGGSPHHLSRSPLTVESMSMLPHPLRAHTHPRAHGRVIAVLLMRALIYSLALTKLDHHAPHILKMMCSRLQPAHLISLVTPLDQHGLQNQLTSHMTQFQPLMGNGCRQGQHPHKPHNETLSSFCPDRVLCWIGLS